METRLETRFDGRKAFEHLRVLTDGIGPRHGSSSNELKAAKYLHACFKRLGLKTSYNEYPIYSFERAEASLRRPDGSEVPCRPFPMTAGTPRQGVGGKVVFLEDAHEAFLDERIAGSIVVTFNTFDRAIHEEFLRFKPAGLVSIQSRNGQLHVASPWRQDWEKELRTVPSVCLTFEDGMALLDDLPEALTIHSRTVGQGWRLGRNVIADLAGTGASEDVVILCAHYDSVWIGPGAFDNGGGTAAILELARVYREKGSKYTLRFCAFGGEEMGLWGSKGYVRQLQDLHDKARKSKAAKAGTQRTDLERIRFVINLDMLGLYHGRSNALALGPSDIAASVRFLANEQRYPIGIQEDKVYSSDNRYFNFLGIPSLSFNRCGYADAKGHTAGDTIDQCSPEGIAHIGRFVEAWIDRYLMRMHRFPFERRLPPSSRTSVDALLKGKAPFHAYDRNALLDKAARKQPAPHASRPRAT